MANVYLRIALTDFAHRSNNKILIIKCLRALTGAGLYDTKQFIEEWLSTDEKFNSRIVDLESPEHLHHIVWSKNEDMLAQIKMYLDIEVLEENLNETLRLRRIIRRLEELKNDANYDSIYTPLADAIGELKKVESTKIYRL